MATLEELYNKALTDETEHKALTQAVADPHSLAAFLAERGCQATPEEARVFMKERLTQTDELSPEELAEVTGGKQWRRHWNETSELSLEEPTGATGGR